MIIPAPLLFHVQLSAPLIESIPRSKGRLLDLPSECSVFVPSSLDREEAGFELQLAWNPNGLGIVLRVLGKRLTPSGRRRDLRASDHVQFFFDTRHTASIHRATEFCSALVVLPADEDADDEPTAAFVEIAQQRTSKRGQSGKTCRLKCRDLDGGYELELWVPGSELPGFAEAPEIGMIGFCLMIEDSELGQLPLNLGGDFPVSYDPSTWIQLRLMKS